MFEQTFVLSPNRTRSGASLAVSLLTQTGVILVLILIPLVYTEALPRAQWSTLLMAPPPPPPERVTAVRRAPRVFEEGMLHAPKTIPERVALIQDENLSAPASTDVVGSIPGVPPGNAIAINTLIPTGIVAPPPPPVIKDPPKPKIDRIRVSGGVIQASLIKRVVPQYPPLARQARVQGTVRFTAIISKDGTIQNLQLISGHPLLVGAATDAIKQWVYKPTLLGENPVEVITQIDFTFTLNQ